MSVTLKKFSVYVYANLLISGDAAISEGKIQVQAYGDNSSVFTGNSIITLKKETISLSGLNKMKPFLEPISITLMDTETESHNITNTITPLNVNIKTIMISDFVGIKD